MKEVEMRSKIAVLEHDNEMLEVTVTRLEQQLTEKEATIKELEGKLREIRALIAANWFETAKKHIDAALKEGDKE